MRGQLWQIAKLNEGNGKSLQSSVLLMQLGEILHADVPRYIDGARNHYKVEG